MSRLLLVCAVLAVTIPAIAQGWLYPSVPALPAMPMMVVAPVVMDSPLRGVVTLVQPYGQFYLNLGTKDQLGDNAELLILRDSLVIGRARAIRVNWLDSVAELAPESRGLRLQSGDTVLVQVNPIIIPRTPILPPYEITDSVEEMERVYALFLLVVAAFAIF